MLKEFDSLGTYKIGSIEDAQKIDWEWLVRQRDFINRSATEAIQHPRNCNCVYCAIFMATKVLPYWDEMRGDIPFDYELLSSINFRISHARDKVLEKVQV